MLKISTFPYPFILLNRTAIEDNHFKLILYANNVTYGHFLEIQFNNSFYKSTNYLLEFQRNFALALKCTYII
jgi:hypothetical protein